MDVPRRERESAAEAGREQYLRLLASGFGLGQLNSKLFELR